MQHPPLSRISFFLVLLPLLAALSGCSLFGIATKGNLNELADKQEQEHRQLQTQVRQSEQEMDGRVTQVEGKTRELDQDMVRYEAEIQSAKLQLQVIKLDMDAFEEGLDRASNDSKQALRIQHDSVISERDRLYQRLTEIDALILSWEQQRMLEPEGTITPVPGGLIVPEENTDSRGSAEAASASNETSVWKNRQSGSSSR
jgi:predicted RNase H-like nuclease (RuvC/YqgF family)